jgi:hypothetical protein
MKVKTLINRLLNYDMDVDVELVIYGDNEERFSCTLNGELMKDDWQKGIHVHYQMILLMDMVEVIIVQ